MSRFESGGVPYPDYDAADVDNFNRKVEFTDDVFIYGKLYTELDAKDITFDDNQGFNSITLSDDLFVNGIIFKSLFNKNCFSLVGNLKSSCNTLITEKS